MDKKCVLASVRLLPKFSYMFPENPPLLLTNERIITFADMWRGGGKGPRGVEGGQCPLF